MYRRDPAREPRSFTKPPRPGLGIPCRDAQADGVPCGKVRVSCDQCDRLRAQQPGSWSVREELPTRPANDA